MKFLKIFLKGKTTEYSVLFIYKIHDDQARINWKEDSANSIRNKSSLKLETEVPSAPKPKFQMWIKQIPAVTEDIVFEQANISTSG